MQNSLKLSVTILTISLLTNSSVFAQEIKANELKEYADPYSLINNLTLIILEEQALTIKVFETGGGDPAMNGNKLILHIFEWDYVDGSYYTWDTGINIYEVMSVQIKDNKCIIKCTEHQFKDDTGQIQEVPVQYVISYYLDENNHLKDTINIEKKTGNKSLQLTR